MKSSTWHRWGVLLAIASPPGHLPRLRQPGHNSLIFRRPSEIGTIVASRSSGQREQSITSIWPRKFARLRDQLAKSGYQTLAPPREAPARAAYYSRSAPPSRARRSRASQLQSRAGLRAAAFRPARHVPMPAQEPARLVGDPLADRERPSLVGQHLERAEMRGQHGAHREGGLRVLGIDDRLHDRALHRLGERRELGLQEVVDQYLSSPSPPAPRTRRRRWRRAGARRSPRRGRR